MFRLIGFIIALWIAYCVFTSDLFATILHVGAWILVGLVVLGISALFATSAPSGGSRGGHYSGSYGYSHRRRTHRSPEATYASAYEHELRRQTRRMNREQRMNEFMAESEARHERWRREDAEEADRINAAHGRW